MGHADTRMLERVYGKLSPEEPQVPADESRLKTSLGSMIPTDPPGSNELELLVRGGDRDVQGRIQTMNEATSVESFDGKKWSDAFMTNSYGLREGRRASGVWMTQRSGSALLCLMALAAGCAHRDARKVPGSARRVLLLAPLDFEFAGAVAALDSAEPWSEGEREGALGAVGPVQVLVIRTGWGKSHAAGAAALGIQRFNPDLVVMAGVGGGLGERVASGDVVIAASTFQYDLGKYDAKGKFERWAPESPREVAWELETPSDAALVRRAGAASNGAAHAQWCLNRETPGAPAAPRPACQPPEERVGRAITKTCIGRVASGDGFVESVPLARELLAAGAVAVDMETAAAALETRNARRPFVAIRVISDVVVGGGGYELYMRLKPAAKARLTEVLQPFLRMLASEPQDAGAATPSC
jgi:adenosylhomocysteine nucleosidase